MKFKLVPLQHPYTDQKTGVHYTHTAPELINQPCTNCFGKGWIHVAYSLNEETYSVYKFLCSCQGKGGIEKLDCLPDFRYNRPPDYTTAELEGTVFIHPRLNKLKAFVMKGHLARKKAELGLDVDVDEIMPF